tara:strand:- start:294 stop:971 length:678 start_codon:yes stop_codon:yes gene_type:complete
MDLLPKVQVDLIEEEPKALKEELESDEDTVSETVTEVLPEVTHKPIIPEENIFQGKEPVVKPVKEKPVKKKRVMTQEQLDRLAKGREKALAKRRAAAAEKKELKDLQKKKKDNELNALRREVGGEPVPTPAPAPSRAQSPVHVNEKKVSFTSLDDLPQELLIKLQQAAIEGYDTKRKARKEQKKKDAESNHIHNAKMNMISDAIKPKQPAKYGEPGYFSSMWSIS